MSRLVRCIAFAIVALLAPQALFAQGPCEQDDPPPPPECYSVSVTPDGQVTPTRPPNSGPYTATFTIQNLGNPDTYFISCGGANGVTCTGTSITEVFLFGSTTVQATYSVGSAGTGTLTLDVWGTYASDAGWFSVPISGSMSVAVTPDGGTAPTRTANTGGHSETFTVQNTGSISDTYTFSCAGSAGVTCGTPPGSVTLAGGASTTRSMPYSVGAPGTGTLTLTAQGTGVSNSGNFSVPIVSYGVAVTPDGGTAATREANTSGFSETFTVQNTGSASNTYSFSCSAGGGLTCGTPPSSVTIGAGLSTNVSMPYSTGPAGTGTLTLTASGTNASNPGFFNVPVVCTACFAPSVVSDGLFTKDNRYLLQETADTYESASGRITQFTDARGKVTTYGYGGNVNNAFLIRTTRVHDASGLIDLVTEITYDGDGLVSSIKDEGWNFKYFTYDLFGRLRQVKNHAGITVHAYGYTYSRTSPNWTFNPASPNAVVDSAYIAVTPSIKAIVNTEYVDGLGRTIQTVLQEGPSYHVTTTQYDLLGRVWRNWKAYTRTSAGYDPNFITNATTAYNVYHLTGDAKPYSETSYTTDALARVKQVTPEYIGTTPTAFKLHTYGVDVPFKQQYSETTDELGKKARTYTDLSGNEARVILGYGATEATTTQYVSSVLGERLQSTDSRGIITTFAFDTRGLRTARTSPDAGTQNAKHDKSGNVRYTQDARQAALGQVYFTNYDFADRALTSGQGAATFSSLDPDITNGLETTQGNWLIVRAYDAKPSTAAFPWSLFAAQINPLTLSNVAARLAAVATKSNGAWQVMLISYDADGQVATRYTFTQANSGGTVLTALNTTVTYVRDLRNALLERWVTVGAHQFNHWFEYDLRGLLWKVFASNTGSKPLSPDVTYTYRPSGKLESRLFAGGSSVPIRYTIRDQVERIGNPTGTAYPFSALYGYHANGTVASTEFYSAGSPIEKRFRYVFGTASYDALNRLKSADYSSWSGTAWTITLANDLANIGYDAAGNITTLQRYRQAATLIDNLTYAYTPGTNRLALIDDVVALTGESWDAEDGSFSYDANGNMLTAPGPYSITAATYDQQNLPLTLSRGGVVSSYRYDDDGNRISKQTGTGNTEVYIRDGDLTLGVFTVDGAGAITSKVFNIVAVERIVGRLPNTGNKLFYHTDALGSTRSVVDGASVVESYDYEPWGLVMALRTFGSGTKEGFTGKEQDAETGLDYFGARYYMPVLGRWTAVDPEADKFPQWSPYNYTLDNPLALVDPDGRCPKFLSGKPCSGAIAMAVSMIPVVGDVIDVASAAIGTDILTGEKLSAVERVATLVGTVVGSGRAARTAVRAVAAVVEGAGDVRRAARGVAHADEAADAAAGARRIGGDAAGGGTERVERAMSRDELVATERTGLVRGGRSGTHHVSDAVNTDAGRARQRLALPQTPEVRVTLEVPAGSFSTPSRVKPANNMPGGGMERTATGNIPTRVVGVQEYKPKPRRSNGS